MLIGMHHNGHAELLKPFQACVHVSGVQHAIDFQKGDNFVVAQVIIEPVSLREGRKRKANSHAEDQQVCYRSRWLWH
jgi:hypothetical protein